MPRNRFERSWAQPGLEIQLKRELNLALRDYRVGNNTSRSRTVVNKVVWLRENSMVEGVKEFCTKLQTDLLGQTEVFSCRKVRTLLSGPGQNVLARVAETSGRTVGHWKIIDVEP